MAVIRKQRKLLRVLRDLEIQNLEQDINSEDMSDGFLEALTFMSDGSYYVPENSLLLKLIGEKSFVRNKAKQVTMWKKCLKSCIHDGLVDVQEVKNPHRGDHFSIRSVQISNDKGSEMLDSLHYWLVHVPKIFPEPSRMVFSVVTTLITAIITTLITISLVTSNKEIPNDVQYNDEQPTQEVSGSPPQSH